MKKSTTELTSSQNHSLSLAAMNCEKEMGMAFKTTLNVLQKHLQPAIAHHLKLHAVSSFGISGILYRMTKASPHLLSHANGWWGKQLMILFIHSFRMPGLRLRHWNAALA